MSNEQVHRYPRRVTLVIELLSTVSVVVAVALFGRDLLQLIWEARGVDMTYFIRIPWLRDIVVAVTGTVPRCCHSLQEASLGLVPSLGWLALALLVVLLLRYSLPTVRTGARGMLVEFAGDWLPIPWESVRAIKVTDADNRFVLLAETDGQHLTGWHRFYSFIYRLGFRPGFLITSGISDFDDLVKTLLSETDRVARLLEGAKGAKLQEEASSPLFRLLINPGSFFSARTSAEKAAASQPVPYAAGDPVQGSYPERITALFTWGSKVLMALFIIRVAIILLTFLALVFPQVTIIPIFNWFQLRVLPSPWWLLVAAVLVLLVMQALVNVVGNLLPEIAARADGLAVRYGRSWLVIPWARVQAVKITELSEDNRIVLIQAKGGLPLSSRLSSLIYDGSLAPGVLVTSALSNFEPLLQRIILGVMQNPTGQAAPEESPIFQSHARSDLLLMLFNSATAIDKLVEEAREDYTTKELTTARLLESAKPMAALALLPPVILFADRTIQQGLYPDGRLLIVMIVFFLLGMLEWPLVAMSSVALDDTSGGGEEGNRAFYLYPLTQLPRLVAMVGVLILVILSVPFVSTLLWFGMLVWVFVLAAGLWGALYDWRGGSLLTGSLIPVIFQLLILIGYLVLR